jgi:hypothetical protein
MPNVLGKQPPAALAVISRLGLRGVLEDPRGVKAALGTKDAKKIFKGASQVVITNQEPGTGSSVPLGTSVLLRIGCAPSAHGCISPMLIVLG